MIRYTMKPIVTHPTMTVIIRFNRRSFLFCAFLWPSTRSACSERKSVFIRGAVASRSEFGFKRVYVKGIVTIPTTVRIKNGKNCPYAELVNEYSTDGVHTCSSYE
jgi:hypothetical protein